MSYLVDNETPVLSLCSNICVNVNLNLYHYVVFLNLSLHLGVMHSSNPCAGCFGKALCCPALSALLESL